MSDSKLPKMEKNTDPGHCCNPLSKWLGYHHSTFYCYHLIPFSGKVQQWSEILLEFIWVQPWLATLLGSQQEITSAISSLAQQHHLMTTASLQRSFSSCYRVPLSTMLPLSTRDGTISSLTLASTDVSTKSHKKPPLLGVFSTFYLLWQHILCSYTTDSRDRPPIMAHLTHTVLWYQ